MRPPHLLLLVLLLASAYVGHLSARDVSAYQYLDNGGFENDTQAWVVVRGAQFKSHVAADNPEGVRSAAIATVNQRFDIRQTLNAAAPIGPYHVALEIRTAQDLQLNIALADVLAPSDRYDATFVIYPGSWQHVDVTLGVSRAAFLQLTISGASEADQDVYLDDITLDGASPVMLTATPTRTPAPTALASDGATTDGSIAATSTSSAPTPTPPALAITESLQNSGFEDVTTDGEIVAWRKYGGELASTNEHYAGTRGARLTSATDSTKWLFQTVLVQPSSTYAFGAWILHDDPNVRSAVLRISWYASDDGSGEAIDAADSIERLEAPSAAWRFLHTSAVAAPLNAHSARVRVLLAPQSAAQASITVDDASFAPAVAPATPTTAYSRDVAGAPGAGAARSDVRQAEARRASAAPEQASTGYSYGVIVINEVLYDAAGDGPDADSEWVELYNSADAPVNLQGWTLEDAASADTLPSLVIPARGFAIVASSAFRDAYPDYDGPLVALPRVGNGLGNDGDRLALLDADGRLVDAISWGTNASALDPPIADVPAGHSIERPSPGIDTDDAADFVDNDRPTPGSAFDVAAAQAAGGDSTVDILAGTPEDAFGWLPWALAAASGAMLLATVAWRVVSDAGGHRPQA